MTEKTEKPTPKKLREARQRGDFPRSALMCSSCIIVPSGILLNVVADEWIGNFQRWTQLLWSNEGGLRSSVVGGVLLTGQALVPLFICCVAGSCLAGMGLGWYWNLSRISPRLERLKGQLAIAERLREVIKGVLFLGVMSAVALVTLSRKIPALFSNSVLIDESTGSVLIPMLASMFSWGIGTLLVFGCIDFFLERHLHQRKLRMSKTEIKQEVKEAEGDPRFKAHRQMQHRRLSQGGPARGVGKATLIVVNPTHLAVALRYDAYECDAPYLVAKGRNMDAVTVRQEAQRLGIPVIKNIPLARSLVECDVGEAIPEELYVAAAAVLSVAFESTQEVN